ncbi:MAG: hypothetical protein WAX69_20545 [Victivallales bacterium]
MEKTVCSSIQECACSSSPVPLKLSWRIGVPLYEKDQAFKNLVEFLSKEKKIVDEVAFFETLTHHLYFPLEEIQKRAELLKVRVAAMKSAGVQSVGINVLTTLGHLNEAWDFVITLPFQPAVGHNGAISKGCACPNARELREYVRKKYTLFAKAAPDFIWIDDDFRMGNHGTGVSHGCFCPTCLKLFSDFSGRSFPTREELISALNTPREKKLRQGWIENNVRTLESLGRDIVSAIHAVNPKIKTGLMKSGTAYCYEGGELVRLCTALKAEKYRPGGGFYADLQPTGMIFKALETARQCDEFPPAIKERQYELENFPYQTLNKSRSTLINECTLALAYGLNGIAFNCLPAVGDGNLDIKEPLMCEIRKARPFWEAITAQADGLPGHGLWLAWSRGMLGKVDLHEGESWLDTNWGDGIGKATDALGRIGLPMSAHRHGATVTVLAGRVAETFSDAELRQILSGAVLMDGSSLEILEQRGLGDLTGVSISKRWNNGVLERLTSDPLNGPWDASIRDARIEFWGNATGLGDMLEPLSTDVRILSKLESYFGKKLGPCMTAFENKIGGRVIVSGYAPWLFLGSEAKRTQLQNVLDWATRGQLAVRIEETVPLIPVVRLSPEKDRGNIVLLNAGFDVIKQASIRFSGPITPVHLMSPDLKKTRMKIIREKNGWTVKLKDLAPWRVQALLLG